MALNTQVRTGGRRTVTAEFNDLDFSGDSEVDVEISELGHIDSLTDVIAYGYGAGDTNTAEGRVIVPVDLVGTTVTLHSYAGSTDGAPLHEDTGADVDHIVVQATGI